MAEDDLEPLITECPNCRTRFRVNETQLQLASGRVRCGACLTVFQGIDHLVWDSASEFASADEATDALDALLDELEEAPADQASPELKDLDALGRDPIGAADVAHAEEHEEEEPPTADAAGGDEVHGAESEGREPGVRESGWARPPEEWAVEERQLYVGHEDDDFDAAAEEAPEAEDEQSDADAWLEAATSMEDPLDLAEAFEADEETAALLADGVAGVEPQSAVAAEESPHDAGTEEPAEAFSDVAAASAEEAELLTAGEGPAPGAAADADSYGDADGWPASDADLERLPGEQEFGTAEVSFAPEPRRWWIGGVTLLGVLALTAQVFFYQFESWGRDPSLRPLYALACELLGCELPVLRDLTALRSEQLLVRSHPRLKNALVVDAIIVNEANFAQPFPALELHFSNVQGELVAGRRFQPEEYLAGELEGATMIAPRTPVRLELAIDDPGGEAVNYTLKFR